MWFEPAKLITFCSKIVLKRVGIIDKSEMIRADVKVNQKDVAIILKILLLRLSEKANEYVSLVC